MQSVIALTLTCMVASSSIGRAASPEESLAAARAAYIATDYEAALKILSTTDGQLSEQADVYRALCFLALDRMNDVDQVLKALVRRNPSFRMADNDVTPRMIALFDDVRRSTVEEMARERYVAAKASFDAGRFADASRGFESVASLLGSEDTRGGEGHSTRSDLRQLARGFKELADLEIARSEKARPSAVASPPAPVAAAAAVATSPSLPSPKPETIIEGVVQRYALAYSALDAAAVQRVFPSEDESSLRYAFSRLKTQTIEPRDLQIAVDPGGQVATVRLLWVVQAVPKVGSSVKAQRSTTLRLSRTPAGDWNIVERR